MDRPLLQKNKYLTLLLCLFISSTSLTMPLFAATSKGINFEDKVTVDDIALDLHGIGLLKWK